ncbi:hypothetical protein CES85_3134 (plasmid) [Ochrobactrum quorumnocens]|uniref:Uncharacterized protein n=1 Tax=Ochrobactrum quorumnocens TaxID=271865 RepID=A0A248UQ58_9HYPH|nr:hypothetical protein CES85_3134 [[Ochrobactrum] quorumnocens]
MNAPVLVTAAGVFNDVKTMKTKGAIQMIAIKNRLVHKPIRTGSRFILDVS